MVLNAFKRRRPPLELVAVVGTTVAMAVGVLVMTMPERMLHGHPVLTAMGLLALEGSLMLVAAVSLRDLARFARTPLRIVVLAPGALVAVLGVALTFLALGAGLLAPGEGGEVP